MKRILTFSLLLCILLSCAACGGEKDAAPSFFYLRTEETIRYGEPGAMVTPVAYENSGDASLEKLLRLYLNGPGGELCRNPFPKGTRLLSLSREKNLLALELSREFSALDGIQLSLAGACLVSTCHSLAGYDTVQVRCGETVYEFKLNDFTFLDEAARE